MLAVAVTLTTGLFTSTFASDVAVGQTIDFRSSNSYGGTNFYDREGNKDGKFVGTCIDPEIDAVDEGEATVDRKVENSKLLAKTAYYYGYEKGWTKNGEIYPGFDKITYSFVAKCLNQAAAVGYDRFAENYNNDRLKRIVKDILDECEAKSAAPDGFEIYMCSPTDNSQRFCLYYMNETGKLRLKKSSAITDITG